MKKYNENKEENTWTPTLREAKDLEEALKLFSAKRIGPRLIPKFLLWCETKNYISFDEFGNVSVKNPLAYHRAIETDSLREWHNAKELEHIFESFPEERVAFQQKIADLLKEWRTMIPT